jgi:predicted DNA-binding protein
MVCGFLFSNSARNDITYTMLATASTPRLEPDVQIALERLSKNLRRPKNQLINEAVRAYVHRMNREWELTLESTINALRSHRLRDPDFKHSTEAFVDAEANFGSADPAEGNLLATAKSSARTKIRKLLDA